ncbi:hypothetical protein TIFTF001_031596 [Ficus carica]|uniref:F-box domain-containing protein n=1 Tax=Ficus carica TaxID=3494 RepID=A0AA88J5P2_FICCA|nr:hypothetical protein TIFTF001_031596 [Ficus carica]
MEITQLPEECISHIISFTTPRDTCRSSLVSPLFRSASDSDVVWKKFLPSDYRDVVVYQSSTTLNSMTKKALYFHLCDNPIIIGDGKMGTRVEIGIEVGSGSGFGFGMGSRTKTESWSEIPILVLVVEPYPTLQLDHGRKLFCFWARGLSISWGDTPEYWQWTSIPDSSLQHVGAVLRINQFSFVSISKEERIGEGLSMVQDSGRNIDGPKPRDRGDGRKEIELGEFYDEDGEDGSVFCGHIKSGLIVVGVELRPRVG